MDCSLLQLYEHHDKYKLVGQLREAAAALEAEEAGGEYAEYAEARLAYQRELVEKAQQAEGSRKFRPFRLR